MKPISKKRAALMPLEDEIKRRIYDLGNGLCEYCQKYPIADRGHEIVFRSQGGSCVDPFNIIQLCRACHDIQHRKIRGVPPVPVDELLAIVREIRLKQEFKEC